MTSFRLTKNDNSSLPRSFKSFLYNSKEYLEANKTQNYRCFYLEKGNSVAAHLTVVLDKGSGFSPQKAPFGGIEFNEDLTSDELKDWLVQIEDELKTMDIYQLELHQAPEIYQSQSSLNQALTSLGYHLKQERIFHVISVDQRQLVDKMHAMEKRRLLKAQKAGCVFKQYASNDLIHVYERIKLWRDLSEKPLSLEWSEIDAASQLNPYAYLSFGIELKGEMIAATIAIKVNETSLYHFFPASTNQYNTLSPMVMLVDELYTWCQSHQITLLDLGTSYVKGKRKDSLVQFKENMGAVPYLAFSWQKTLS